MKLSDFKGDKGLEVVGKLLLPLSNIATNKEVTKALKKGGLPTMLSAALLHTPNDVKELLAILNDKAAEEFEMDGASILRDMFELISDPELLRLFGVQS